MRRFLGVCCVILVCVIGLGFYLQWFQVSTNSGDTKTNIEITVDKQKVKEDEEKAKEKAKEITEKVKEKASKVGE